jgi:hypothetical protein
MRARHSDRTGTSPATPITVRTLRAALALAAASMLTACPGGSSTPIDAGALDGPGASTDGALPTDGTPASDAEPSGPHVIATRPADSAIDVDPDALVEVTFSRDMAAGTINAASFTVACDGAAVVGTVSYDPATRVATFRPQPRLPLRGHVTATVTTAVTDATGTALAAAHAWSFTVRDGRWGSPTLLGDDLRIADIPSIAVDASGNGLAVWTEDGVQASRYLAGVGWSSAIVLEAMPGDAPQVAVDPAGNALAIWRQLGSPTNLESRRFVPGTGWGATTPVETDDADGHAVGYLPQVAVDPAGNAIVVWDQADASGSTVWARRFVPGTGWMTASSLGTGLNPWVAVDAAGDALVVWMTPDVAGFSLKARRFDIVALGWAAATLIETEDAGLAARVRLGFDAAGNATAVWYQYDGTRATVGANRFTAGAGWGTAMRLESEDGFAIDPEIAVDPAGNAIVVWIQEDATGVNLRARRFEPASGWGSTTVVDTGAGAAGSPAVAIDTAGNAIAIWQQVDVTRTLFASRLARGATWSAPVAIDTADFGDTFFPRIAIDPTGAAVAVWERSIGAAHSGSHYQAWGNAFR